MTKVISLLVGGASLVTGSFLVFDTFISDYPILHIQEKPKPVYSGTKPGSVKDRTKVFVEYKEDNKDIFIRKDNNDEILVDPDSHEEWWEWTYLNVLKPDLDQRPDSVLGYFKSVTGGYLTYSETVGEKQYKYLNLVCSWYYTQPLSKNTMTPNILKYCSYQDDSKKQKN